MEMPFEGYKMLIGSLLSFFLLDLNQLEGANCDITEQLYVRTTGNELGTNVEDNVITQSCFECAISCLTSDNCKGYNCNKVRIVHSLWQGGMKKWAKFTAYFYMIPTRS